MEFQKLLFKPGINKETTKYANTGGWESCDKVRFRQGLPEKIGGWTQFTDAVFTGNCRFMFRFSILDNSIYTFLGTHLRSYLEDGGTNVDISPWLTQDTGLTDPWTTTLGSADVEVNKTSHGLIVGDRIDISGATLFDGIAAVNLNGERVVASITDTDNYKFTAGETATAGASGGGGGITIQYLLGDGLDAQISGTGWGSDGWNEGAWGEPGTTAATAQGNIRTWSADNFGEDLVMAAYDTGVFYWDATNGTSTRSFALSQIAGASGVPTLGRVAIVSTVNRHAIIFGCDTAAAVGTLDPLLIRWCDQEDIANWTPSTTSTAGSLLIGSGSEIITAKQSRQEILVWTDADLHSMQYVGGNFTFGINQLAKNTSIMGRLSATVHLGIAYWMGKSAFYLYDGQVRELDCTVEDYVFSDLNESQSEKILGTTHANESEIIWFYPSASSDEIDRYVIFNVKQGIWYIGNLERTAWIDTLLSETPLAASADGFIYSHEDGFLDGSTSPGSQIIASIESSPLEVGDGHTFMFMDRIMPDITFRNTASGVTPSVTMTLTAFDSPGGATPDNDSGSVVRSVVTPETFSTNIWIRLRGRSITFKVEDTVDAMESNASWRLGASRLSLRSDGRK